MTQDQFTDAVMEQLFVRGLTCPLRATVAILVGSDWQTLGPLTDPAAYIETLSPFPGLITQAMMLGKPASAAGARDQWMAVHEAAHAIVVVKAGIGLRGVRFYGDGFPGETGFEEPDWWESTDEDMLQSLVRISVAANVAEFMKGFQPEGGYPSQFFDDRDPAQPGHYPSDVIGAWDRAARLATVRFEKEGKEPTIIELRAPKRAIIAQAEAEADDILRANAEALDRLARELLRGPMTGAAVRAIVGG
jgi:hypothetical protein